MKDGIDKKEQTHQCRVLLHQQYLTRAWLSVGQSSTSTGTSKVEWVLRSGKLWRESGEHNKLLKRSAVWLVHRITSHRHEREVKTKRKEMGNDESPVVLMEFPYLQFLPSRLRRCIYFIDRKASG